MTIEVSHARFITTEDVKKHIHKIADALHEFADGITIIPNKTQSIYISATVDADEITSVDVEINLLADPRIHREADNV